MPEGFPAHPHRGFETVTYVLPGRSGLTHRDSEGCKMRYGDGAVQWMTAGRGMLHEEMWDVESWETGKSRGAVDAELYQLWVNLPPRSKLVPPRVQLLIPPGDTRGTSTEVQREGSTPVRRAAVLDERRQNGAVRIRTLARPDVRAATTTTDDGGGAALPIGADTYSPMVIEHVELHSEAATYTLPLPEGWTCIVYVRRGAVTVGGADGQTTAGMFETVYLDRRGGDGLVLGNANGGGLSDVLVLAGEPIGAPVVASGTMVMNSESEVQTANYDYQRGAFGVPWPHELDDAEWARQCDARKRAAEAELPRF